MTSRPKAQVKDELDRARMRRDSKDDDEADEERSASGDVSRLERELEELEAADAPPAVFDPTEEGSALPIGAGGEITIPDAPAEVEPDVPGLKDASGAGDVAAATTDGQSQTEAELEEVAGRMSDEHPLTNALRGHLKPAQIRESYDVDQAEGMQASDSAVNVSFTTPPPAKGGEIAPLNADDMAPEEMVGDLPADTSGLKMPAWKPEVALPPRERVTADGTYKKAIDGAINFRGNDRADVIGQPAAKGGSIAPETPDDMLGGPAKDGFAPTLDLRLPPWTILQYRIWKAVSSWKMPTRIAAAAVPVVGAAVVVASVVAGGGAPQAAATPAPAPIGALQPQSAPPARTARPTTTPSPVGAERMVFVYVRLGGSTRQGCPAAGTIFHEDFKAVVVKNPGEGNSVDYPLGDWTHPRCGGTSVGLADAPSQVGTGSDVVPGFESPLFRPDTIGTFEKSVPSCSGNTCVDRMVLTVRNRAPIPTTTSRP